MTSLRKSVLPSLHPQESAGLAPTAAESAANALAQAEGTLPPAPPPQEPAEAVSLATGDLPSFRPSEAQVRVKAKFWSRWAEQPLLSAEKLPSLATVQSITGSAAIKTWWPRAGFQEWFLNTRVTDERLEYLMHLALSAAEDILLNDAPNAAGYRVSMIKTIAEMAGRIGRAAAPAQAAGADARRKFIEGASKEDLVKLLEASGMKIVQERQVDALSPTQPTPQAGSAK